MGKPSELYFPLQAGFSTFSRVPYLIDEFKVWDSDVIGGEEPEQPQTEPLYCVIDLSGGTAAESYPVTYLDAAPTGGWSDEYKTNKIVLRRIDPGTYTQTDSMGSDLAPELQRSRTTTISKAFYIGVFELTQAQYQNITGENPSRYKGDTRPVEYVSYFQLRGDWPGSLFPVTNTVDYLSFMGVMRARTGLPSIDIPTEAQWEYACRAGTTSAFNNGGDAESDLKLLGRYSGNRNDGNGEGEHAVVGSYQPNAWGLYDMHGNVWEWCLDWYQESIATATDASGDNYNGRVNIDPSNAANYLSGASASGAGRVLRGGGWNSAAGSCRPAYRYYNSPSNRDSSRGFRLACSAGLQ
jgi:formylglycine-generating enzyme required for sulfatase activity